MSRSYQTPCLQKISPLRKMPFFCKKTALRYGRFCEVLYTALGIYLTALLLRYPALSLQYAGTGLRLWFQKMIPTLLPFMILSGILLSMNLTEKFVRALHPLLHAIYRISPNGCYTLFMGFLCGFPMGARIVGQLREQEKISREEGNRLLAFCNNIGPIYFLSYVVPTLSIEKPLLPFLIMYGVPLLYGILVMRLFPPSVPETVEQSEEKKTAPAMGLLTAVDTAIQSGLIGIGKLGGYMVFFNLLNILFVPFRHLPSGLLAFYQLLLEITSGIDQYGQSYPYMVLIMLPFGGFSCIAQTYSMIRQTDLSIRAYLFHKLAQTALTACAVVFFCGVFSRFAK